MNFFTNFDVSLLHSLYEMRNLTAVVWWIRFSELGSSVVVIGLALCAALLFSLRRQWHYAIGILVTVFGAGAAALAIKEIVHRARPDALYQAYLETGYSFPSGHATLSSALYGFCMYLTWQLVPSRTLRIIISVVLTILIVVICFSRLYLGVHYLSDVIGGVIVGVISVAIGARITRELERRSLPVQNSL